MSTILTFPYWPDLDNLTHALTEAVAAGGSNYQLDHDRIEELGLGRRFSPASLAPVVGNIPEPHVWNTFLSLLQPQRRHELIIDGTCYTSVSASIIDGSGEATIERNICLRNGGLDAPPRPVSEGTDTIVSRAVCSLMALAQSHQLHAHVGGELALEQGVSASMFRAWPAGGWPSIAVQSTPVEPTRYKMEIR